MDFRTATPARPHRFARAMVVALIALASFFTLTAPPASAASADEAELLGLMNQSRAQSGLPALQDDQAAASIARTWAATMAATQVLAHNPNLASLVGSRVTSEWTRIGENVGMGSTVAQIHSAFLASTAHRSNVLGDYNRVGVGAARDGRGTLWVAVVFIKGPSLGPPPGSPFGNLETASRVPGGLRVRGWAIDPDTTSSIAVHVYVDGAGYNIGNAQVPRGDVGAAYPAYGNAHGFDAVVPAPPGWHNVCAYGINVGPGAHKQLRCIVTYVEAGPIGNVELVRREPGGLRVTGWALDPDSSASIDVHVYVDGAGYSIGKAQGARGDVGAAYPGYGSSHGFDGVVPAAPGWHTVCAWGINIGGGQNRLLRCHVVYVESSPIGNLELAAPAGGGIQVVGWGLDPDVSSSIVVHVYVDGVGYSLNTAQLARGDVGAAYPGYGSAHGFSGTVPASPGRHTVCAWGINVSTGQNRLFTCRVSG